MRVIERAVMKDGTEINLEDWEEKGFYISAYPKAQRSGKYGWVVNGETFRLTMTGDTMRDDFKALKNGHKTLEDLSEHFWNGEKDMWYLGMNVVNNDY